MVKLKDLRVGTKVSCKIEGTEVEGKIQIEDGEYFICQDRMDGDRAENTLGYKYSWVIGWPITDGELEAELESHGVTNLKIISQEDMMYKEGDILADGFYKRKVLGVCGSVYLMSKVNNFDVCADGWTKQELDEADYKLKTEEEAEEVTMKEVCAKFGKNVKIKKEED
jgi:hypothetical protein